MFSFITINSYSFLAFYPFCLVCDRFVKFNTIIFLFVRILHIIIEEKYILDLNRCVQVLSYKHYQ